MVKKKQPSDKEFGDSGEGNSRSKSLEEALARSEERYRTMLDQMQDTYHELDLAGKFTFVSESATRSFGYFHEELIGQSYRLAMPEEDVKGAVAAFNEVYRTGQPNKGVVHRIRHKDGSISFSEASVDLNRDANGKVTGFKVVNRDITARRRIEEQLRESEERFSAAFIFNPDPLAVSNADTARRLMVNPAFEKWSGYCRAELLGETLEQLLVNTEDRDRIVTQFQIKSELSDLEIQLRRKDGEIRDVLFSLRFIEIAGRKYLFSRIHDITERKLLEMGLRESEERFRRLSENAPDVIYRYRLKPSPGFEYVSPASVNISGYTPEDYYADPLLAASIVHPDDRDQFRQHFRNLDLSGTPLTVRWIHKDGHIIWSEEIDVPIYNAKGEIIALEGIARDITGRKQAEFALQESEKGYRLLSDYYKRLNDISMAFAEASNTESLFNKIAEMFRLLTGAIAASYQVFNNQTRALKIVSLSVGPLIRDKLNAVFDSGFFEMQMDVSPELEQLMTGLLISKPQDLYELTLGTMPQDQSDKFNEVTGCRGLVAIAITYARELFGTCIAYLPEGHPVVPDDALRTFVYITGLEIKRKKAEEDLRERDAQYRLLSEHTTDSIWLMDMSLKTTYHSPSVEKIRGYSADEIMEMTLEQNLTLESLNAATKLILEELPRVQSDPGYNPVLTLDLEYYCKDGSTAWAENKFSVIRDETGRPVSILGESRDITGRKRVEDALKASEAQYRLLSEHTTDFVMLMDMNLNPIYQSPSAERLTGYTPQEMKELPLEKRATPESFKAASEVLFKELVMMESNHDYNPVCMVELENYRKDGTTLWTENKFSVIRDEGGKPESILIETRDITERKRAEDALKASEAQYRLLSEHITDTVWLMDMNLKIIYVSPSAEKLTGLTHQEIMEMPIEKRVTPESFALAYSAFLTETVKLAADPDYNSVLSFELEYYLKDGSTAWLDSKFSIIRDSNGKPVSILGEARDITGRKKAEDALRASEAQYRLLAEHTTDFVWLMDMELKPIYQSPSAEKLTGFTQQDLMELPIEKRVTPESLKLAAETFLREMPRVESDPGYIPNIRLELEICRKDGTTLWSENKFSIIRDGNGKPVSILGEARDITERKLAEEAIRGSTMQFQSIVEHVNDIFYMQSINREIIYISPQVEQVLGYALAEMQNGWQNYLTDNPMNLAGPEKSQLAITTGEKQGPYLLEFMHKDGTKRLAEINESPLKNDKGEVIGIVGAARDITERKRIESALRESEEKYRMVVENALEGIFVAVDGMIKFANNRAEAFTGYSQQEIASRPFIEFIHPDDRQMVAKRHIQRLQGMDVSYPYSFRILDKSGDIRWVEIYSALITWEGKPATLNFLTDISDRRRLEEERQRVDKLESVGLLAGGIAHDFNNILTAILGNISLALLEAAPGSELRDSLAQAEKASLRAKDLTGQLLTFSKGGAPVTRLASLTELLRDTVSFALRGSNVKCRFSIPEDLWHAEIDTGQVSQVIHNLVINAQQAMPEGGTIELTAQNITLSETRRLGKGLPLKKGNYVRIAVADHGSGIPAQHIDRIFDPFFTTKQKGSGLGLATSFSIARQHGGHLSVVSTPGSGSTFYLYLPASRAKSTPRRDNKMEIKPAGKARILVMDDEKGVREVAGRMLKHVGYRDIEFAADGAEAISLYKAAMESGNPFTVAILDLTIPGGMGGKMTIKKLRKIDPEVKAIVSSGYVDDSVIAKYKEHGFSGIVAKPYTIEELGKALQDVIGQGRVGLDLPQDI